MDKSNNQTLKDKLKKLSQKIDDIKKQNFENEMQDSAGITLDDVPTQNSTNAVKSGGVFSALAQKQNTLTAGSNISISGNTISATDTTYTAGTGLTLSGTTFSADTTVLATKTDLAQKQNVLTAGSNISISNNVISATGGLSSVTASDVNSQSATSGKVLTANGSGGASWESASGGGGMTQEQETKLNQTYSYFLSHVVEPDPYYTGNTPSDYTSGSIFQTYDFDERRLNLQTTNSINLPTLYFATETSSSADIFVDIKFFVQSSLANVMFKTYVNDVLVDTTTQDVSALNTEIHFSKTIYDVVLNSNQRGNTVYVQALFQTTNLSKTLQVVYQKIGITAANIEFLNKICPFDAIYIDGNYHITDATGPTAKVATIAQNNMFNLGNLTWTDTNIVSNNLKVMFNSESYQQTYMLNQIGYLSFEPDNRYRVNLLGEAQTETNKYDIALDFRPSFNTNFYMLAQRSNSNNSINNYYSTQQVLSTNSGTALNAIKIVCARFATNIYPSSAMPTAIITIDRNGLATFHSSNQSTAAKYHIALDYCQDATLFVDNISTSGEYDVHVYYKRFDKIIYKKYHMLNYVLTLISQTEMGSYDKIFKMANNDYFAVKNNQLIYTQTQI